MIDDAGMAMREIRETPRQRRGALVAGTLVGLGMATIHPLGLVLGGALVGLASRTFLRAIAAGLAFGVLTLAVFVFVVLPGSPTAFAALTPISYLTVAIGIVAPLLGSLARGIV